MSEVLQKVSVPLGSYWFPQNLLLGGCIVFLHCRGKSVLGRALAVFCPSRVISDSWDYCLHRPQIIGV